MKKSNLIIIGLIIGASLLGILPLSYVLGSHKFYFSTMIMLLPTCGGFLTTLPTLLLTTLFFTVRALIKGVPLTLGIPTIAAALTWSLNSNISKKTSLLLFLLEVVLPLACMSIFLLHPIAGQAPAYAAYWLIPCLLFIAHELHYKSTFATALSSSFVAHAIGSILWLFLVPMTAEQWAALVPIVAIERLTFAAGSTLAYKGIKYVSIFLPEIFLRKAVKKSTF